MVCISKLVRCLGLVIAACSLVVVSTIAPVSATTKSEISKEEMNAIVSNCSTIKQSLSQLQKADSKTRTYLGTTYETIAGKFITPLNLRLVRNNRPTLSEIQSDFSAEQTKFRDSYTEYMREMETLTAINCQTEPEKFYNQLVVVRERRAKVRLAVEELNQLTTAQYQAVVKLQKELSDD